MYMHLNSTRAIIKPDSLLLRIFIIKWHIKSITGIKITISSKNHILITNFKNKNNVKHKHFVCLTLIIKLFVMRIRMMIMRNTVNDDVDDVKMIIKMMKDKENDNTHESYQL